MSNNEIPSPPMPPESEMEMLVRDFGKALKDQGHPYHSLACVLIHAYKQAAWGKGKERHANDLPFDKQPMQTGSQLLGSADGLRFQVIKKIRESKNMDYPAQQRELLGAIVYTAGVSIYNKIEKEKENG